MAVLLVFIALFVQASCKSEENADEKALEIRSGILASDIEFSAYITADYGDRVYDFKLDYSSENSKITVVEPEIIAGVAVSISDSGTVLNYDGAELNTGALTDDGLTPIASIPTIVTEWHSGYISDSYFETLDQVKAIVIQTTVSDSVIHSTWFDRETGQPIKSEIASDGYVVIQCEYEGSQFTTNNSEQ